VLSKIIKVLGYIWIGIAGLLILIGYYSIFINQGFARLQEILSPFNFWNLIVNLVILAPGIGLVALAKKMEKKND
jgi:hypothetical protein